MKITSLLVALLCLFVSNVSSQTYTQTIRGSIIDKEAMTPLPGANVTIKTTDPIIGTSTDHNGQFIITSVPVGRHDIEISYLGYETQYLNGVILKSGKELVLELGLIESFELMQEVTINASEAIDKRNALNEFATLSARTFSVEETSRYAAAAFDPGRMALNYAGVSVGATDDLTNQIVVRGNSPLGVHWRLEGIQIPNPNHFGELGNTGGGISMLSSSTLTNSDFYTGAFPAEIGNATSAAFDLKLRTGNNNKREYAVMIGALGIEAAAEGPFTKKGRASYLINYRYSTLGLLGKVGLSPTGDILPTYSDLSFKFNFPTNKFGNISIFGLSGSNLAEANPEPDKSTWDLDDDPGEGFDQKASAYNIGLTHRILLDDQSYLHTVALYSKEDYDDFAFYLDSLQEYKRINEYHDLSDQSSYRGSITYNRKLNNRNNIRIGAIGSNQELSFKSEERVDSLDSLVNFYDNQASGGLFQAFAQWKHRASDRLTIISGFHFSKLSFNTEKSFEPRLAVQWQVNSKNKISLTSGVHSRMENLGLYFFEGTYYDGAAISAKNNLGMPKAIHHVLGYDYFINEKLSFKAELYHQHLYDITISKDPNSTFSMINAAEIWDYIGLSNAEDNGTGTNIGLDLTLEKFYSNGHYYMITTSIYDSKFKAANGKSYNTRYNGNFSANLVGGKEWNLKSSKQKERSFGINGRFVVAGGRRQTPLNIEASLFAKEPIMDIQRIYSERGEAYARLDLGLSLTTNKENSSHMLRLDIQNVTNRENVFSYEYNAALEKKTETQTGLFPFLNYRIEF